MPASKRRRRINIPIEFLRLVVVCAAFAVVYLAVLILHERMLKPSGGSHDNSFTEPAESVVPVGFGDSGVSGGPKSKKQSEPSEAKPSQSQDETPPPTHLSAYSQVYLEKEISLLGDDVSNTGLEAVKHTDEWKSAANWNHDFVQMNQTFNLGMDPPVPPAVPAFQALPFEVPPVQMPAFPTLAQP
jgi:hypothetical protein